LQEKFVIG